MLDYGKLYGPQVLRLTAKEVIILKRPVEGTGEFDLLLRDSQQRIYNHKILCLTSDKVERIYKYALKHGEDGLGGRLKIIMDGLRREGLTFS